MVQRLTTTSSKDNAHPLNVNGQSLPEAYEQLNQILRSRLGLQHAGLLAAPVIAPDGSTAWVTTFDGTVVRSANLPLADRAELVKRAERLRADIVGLARQMGEGTGASRIAAEVVARSASVPDGDWLFSVGGRPVQVLWGHTDTSSPDIFVVPRAASPPVESSIDASTSTPGSNLTAAPTLTSAQAPSANEAAAAFQPPTPPLAPSAAAPWRSRRGWAWLFIAVLALLAMALIHLFVPVRPPDDTGAALADAERAVRVLEAEILKKKSDQQQYQCVPDPPPAPASEPPASLPPSPAALEPAPPEPLPVQPPPAASAPPQSPSAPASSPPPKRPEPRKASPPPKAASQPAAVPAPVQPPITTVPLPAPAPPPVACKPPSASDGDAPEVIMIIDASGSMNDRFGGTGSRLDAAKSASGGMIRSLPPAVDVGLVDFDACGHVRRDKFYSAPDRGALLGEIGRLSPRAGTPLAQAISRAGAIASGSAPSIIVVVTDGNDSCGGDPCAAAAAVHRARPNVTINVIDLSDTSEDARVLQCVASKGGGAVLRPGDPLDLNNKMKQAVGPAACAK